jgi:hypothetical protein
LTDLAVPAGVDHRPLPSSDRRDRLQLLARASAVGALALIVAGCGWIEVAPASPETAPAATMTPRLVAPPASTLDPTPLPTVLPEPTSTLPADLRDVNADDLKEVLADSLNFTCPEVDGTDQLLWTCSDGDEVSVSLYGSSPASVTAMRVVTEASREVDRRSWLRSFASLISVEVWQWAEGNFGSNETAMVGGVRVQMTHDAKSDGVLISTEDVGP